MPNAPKPFRSSKRPKRKRQEARPPAHIRGYDWTWHKLRTAFITENPLCIHCEQRGRVTEANEIDHIIPFDGPDDPLRLDWSNLQPLCKYHHRKKTLRDQELGKPSGKLFIVTGPPGAGKSTYVSNNKAANDVVFDFDLIAEAMGCSPHDHPDHFIPIIEPTRRMILAQASRVHHSTWVIYTSHKAAIEAAKQHNGELVTIAETPEICAERLQGRPNVQRAMNRVNQWWNEYNETGGAV